MGPIAVWPSGFQCGTTLFHLETFSISCRAHVLQTLDFSTDPHRKHLARFLKLLPHSGKPEARTLRECAGFGGISARFAGSNTNDLRQ